MNLTTVRTKVADMSAAVSTDRHRFIGGSDAGVIMGLNPYKSLYALWCEKTGKISGIVEDNDAMRTGRDLEQYVAERFMEATGRKVQKSNYEYSLKEYPFMVGHIDRRIVGEDAILECKTANSYQTQKYETGSWPAHYYAQCQHYMAVTGVQRVYLAVLVYPHFYWTVYERDEGEIAALIEAEEAFWKMVENDSPPPADGSESTQNALLERYPNDLGTQIRIPDSMNETLDMLETCKKQIRNLESIQADCENQLRELLGDNSMGSSEDWTVSWRDQTRSTIDQKRLREENPDLYALIQMNYMKKSTSRVLRVRRNRKNKEES